MSINARTGAGKRIWLLLLSQGGYWSAADVAAELELPQKRAEVTIQQMVEYGLVQRRCVKSGRARVGYGVTPSCKVPTGVALTEVLSAASGATPVP